MLELAPRGPAIREIAAQLRAHPIRRRHGLVAACDRFALHCWNGGGATASTHEMLRREAGGVRYRLLAGDAG